MKRIDLSSFPALLFAGLLGIFFSASPAQAQVSPADGCHWLNFDGSNDYVSVANNTTLSPGTNSFSVAGWFKAGNTPAANRILIAKRNMNDGPGNPGFALFLTTTGELRAIIEDGTDPLISVTTAATYQDNTWRHVAANFVRTTGNYEIILYVNGVQVASVGPSAMANSPNNTRPLTLGAALNGANVLQFPLDGELDDFALWRRALALTEIEDLYNGVVTPGQLTSQLRAYWPFEEGSGTTTDDASPNNNIGTLTNGPSWESKTVPSATLFSASPSTFCEGGSTTISFGINNGSTYLWSAAPSEPGVVASFDNPSSQNPGALTVTNVPAGPPVTVDVSVSVTSADGCQVTSNVITVTVRPNPETQPIAGEIEPCIGSVETYTMLNNGSSYTWSITPSVGGNSISTMDNTATVTWGHTTPGAYTISAIETDANGCSTTNTLPVTTKPTPMVNVLPNQGPFCEGNTVPGVTVTGTPGATFSWEITGDNTGWSSSTGMGNVPSFTAVNSGPSVLVSTVTVTATLNGCDSQPVSYTVTVNPSPELTANLTPTICVGESFNLQSLFTAVNLSDANSVDGIVSVHDDIPTSGANQITFPNFDVTPTSDVTYYYRKQATASPGCFDELAVTLFVEGPITINGISFQNNQSTVCEGSNTFIEVDATNAGSGTLNYLWQVNDGNGWVDVDIASPNYTLPAAQNGARLRILNTPLSFDGLDYRCLVSTDQCPALTSPELTLQVTPLPELVAVTETPVTCNGGSNGSVLFAVPLTSNYEYFINPGSSFSGPATWVPASIPFTLEGGLAAGDYNLRLRDAASLCFIDQLITITEPDSITFSVAVQDVSCNGGSDGTLTVSAMGGNASPYSYRLNGGAPQSSNVFTGLAAGTYDVEVLDGFDPSCIAGPQSITIGEPTALEVDPVVMDLSCFESADGMIEPMAAGGTPPYTYDWSGPNGFAVTISSVVYSNNFDNDITGWTPTDEQTNPGFLEFNEDANDPGNPNNEFAGAAFDEYWSPPASVNADRKLTLYKSAAGNTLRWKLDLTNTTADEITELTLNYDAIVQWVRFNFDTNIRSAQIDWWIDTGNGLVSIGSSPEIDNLLVDGNNDRVWLDDATMDALNLTRRNLSIVVPGLSIMPGDSYSLFFGQAGGSTGQQNMNFGIDNLTIIASSTNGKLSDLEAGDYLLTLTDALGCTLDSTITVTQPDELTIDLEPVPHICIDDTQFTLPYSAVGGLTNRFQILNDPAFNGQDAGNLVLTTTGFQVLGASPLTINLNSAPAAPGFYHMLITPRSNVGGVLCTGEPIPFTVYVPNPNNTPVAQELTICSGAAAVFDVSTTELEVPTGLRWAYQYPGDPAVLDFASFDANGDVQVSQVLTNTTMAPINVTFFFRAYTFGPDGIDDNGVTGSDDCVEPTANQVIITVLPEPAGSATATPTPGNGLICSGDLAVIDVNTTITPLSSTRYNWVSTNGGSGTSIEFTDDIEELLTNNSNDNLTVTYTITPYTFGPNGLDDGGTGDDCLGDDVSVVFTVEPEPNATATVTTPEICSGDTALIEVNTTLQITNTRYRWRFRELPSGAWSSFTNNVMYSSDIQLPLSNTTGSLLTYEFEIRPYTYGSNGNNNNGGGDDCVGTFQFVTVDVQPEPVLNPPTFVRVCSDSPLGFDLPTTGANGTPIIGYDIVSKTVHPDLDIISEATVPQTMVSFDYLSGDTYRNLETGFREVSYTIIPYSDENCAGDTVIYTFRIIREPRAVGSTDPGNPQIISACSGEAIGSGAELTGFFGNPPGLFQHDPTVTFNVEVFNPFNLPLNSPNTYPATCLNNTGIENDEFQNFTNNVLFVIYAVTPATNCNNADICEGQTVYYQVEVEPAPQAALSLNLNGNTSPIQNGDNFVACSESNFNITGSSNTNPSDPAHAIWAQVIISGDIEALGFPATPNPVILHGPIDNLNLGTTSLINTTSDPVEIEFTIIPYIETTPSIDPIANPQELDQDECAGQANSFTITINPEPAHNDETLAVCSDQPLGLGLEPVNNTAPGGLEVNEFIEFNTPGMMESWSVPDGVDEIRIEVWGADGGNSTAAGGQPGGSGAYLEQTNIAVSQGDVFNAYAGAAGQNGTTGGGGGGSAITDDLGNLILVAAGGGGGAQTLGGGGQGTSATLADGDGGASNGGGGGGGFSTAGSNGNGAQGGFGGAAGFNGAGGAGFSTGGDGGLGTGGGGGGSLLGGGGGGGHEGGNGGDGAFQLGGYGGASFGPNATMITPGTNGSGLGQTGRVRISWTRTLPPITYTITNIDNPAGLGDGDGIDRSVAPDNVGVADVSTGISDLIAAEQWINNTNDAQTVTYTIVPENDTECGGEPFTVTVTVDPVPTATVTTDAPMNMVCSGEDFEINVSTTITVPTARYRWRRQLNGGGFTGWTNNVPFGTPIAQNFVNISGTDDVYTYEIRPYTYGPNGVNNNAGGDDCAGDLQTISITVKSGPVMPTPANPALIVCSDEPFGSSFVPGLDLNSLSIGSINLLDIIADPGLTYTGTPALPTLPANGLSLNDLNGHSWNNVGSGGLFVTYRIQHVSADGCADDFVDYTVQIRAEPVLASDLDETICSGDATGITLANDLGQGFQGIAGYNIVSIDFDGAFLTPGPGNAVPGNGLPASAIAMDIWTNSSDTGLPVTYLIAPVAAAPNNCVGDAVPVIVNVEPTPTASVDVTVGDDPTVTVTSANSPQAFEICSDATNFTLEASSTTIPSDPTHELWGRLRILGDVEIFDPMAMGTITLFGPIGNLAIASQPLINTSPDPKTITVQILPYIETTPGVGSPSYNAASECAGSQIEFTITVYPQPDFNDIEVERCNEVAFDENLDTLANNAGVGANVQVPVEVSFDYTGALQQWIVPEGVTEVTITAVGADGGNSDFQNGGSGATATRTITVTPGDVLDLIIGGAGETGIAGAGGGAGSGVREGTDVILVAGGGAGAGRFTAGGGGGVHTTLTTGGTAGIPNGGGGGGGNVGPGATSGGQGGQPGAGANGGSFVLAGGWGFGGGGGGFESGTNFGAGGGGGGYRGGNGGLQTGSASTGGFSFRGTVAPVGSVTPGVAGAGQEANGSIILNFLQTVPEITYTIVDLDVPAGLSDADGDVLAVGDSGDGSLLENEAWTNTTNEFQIATYTLSPVAASPLSVDGCPGDNFEVSMTVEPTPRMELGNVTTISQYESYELTICSGETLDVPLTSPTVPSGGINLLQYRLISVTLNGVTGPSLSTPSTLGNASQSVTLNQTWVNTGSGTGTVTYVLRPRIVASPNCPGGDVTFTVTVLPEPVLILPIQTDVCSDAPIGSVFPGFPTMANVPFSGYEVVEAIVSPSLQVISGPTLGMDADVSSDQYRNLTTDNNHFVTYRVVFFSDGAGCASDTFNFNFRVVREARVAAPAPEAVCSDESLTTTLIGYYGPTVPAMHDPNVAFRITYSNPAGLSYTGSNTYDANNTITCVGSGALNDDSWTNTTGVAQEVTYTIVPVRACNSSFECDGEAVTFTATIEPEVTFDLTLTHSGVPAGPQTINVNNAPASSPLALTICADSPFEASITAAAVPSGNSVAMVRVSITDPDNLTGLGGVVNLMQSDLEAYLSFPSGIPNPGISPSTILFRMRPYFDTNGSGNYEAGIDCDLGAFGYDLTVESAVAALVNVQANNGPDDEVCDEETFTIRMRKTPNSVPVVEYQVWVSFGSDLTQTSASPVSTDPMNPTVFGMPGALPNNQVTFDASFSNASTSDQTVTYHIVPVSATGCLGAEVTQVVTIYGSIQADPDPTGICLGSTGTIASQVVGGGGGFTYTWTYQGGTARQFRINNQLFGNNPVPGTPLNNQTADLLLNANIQTGGILITLPGTILMDLVVMDANGCEENFSFEFVIAESPESGTTVPFVPTVCEDGPIVDLYDLLTVGSFDLGGTWSQTGGPAEGILDPVNGTFDPVNITGLTPKIFMFTYTVDNGFCPPVSTAVTLSVQPNPQAGTYVGTPAFVCVGTSTYNLFNLLVPGSFEAGGAWSQTFGPTAIPILPNGDAFVSIGMPGNYTFRYAFAPVGICDGSEVFVNLVIETEANAGMVDPMAINEFCTGQSIDLFSLITGNQPGGVWSELTNSGGLLNPSTGVFDPSNVATGTYEFEYLIVGQAPCTGTDAVTVTVEIQETPNLTLTLELDGVLSATIVAANSPVSRTICSGTEITLNAASAAMPMSGAEVWYAADIVDPGNLLNGLIPEYGPLSLFTDLMQTLTNNGGLENLFITLTPYIETDPNGPLPQLDPNECFGESVSLLITVQETPQGDDLSLVLCSGDPLAISLNDQINNNVFSTFEWSAAENPAVSGESTTTQTSSAITDVLVNNSNQPQTVVYTVTPISNDGCEGDPFTVEVQLESAFFTYTVSLDGFTHDFEDASLTGSAWSWDFGDGGVSSMQNPTHTFALPGTYNVCLEVTTDCGVLQYCEMIMVSGEVCDLINLNAGLNLISTDVDPADPSIATVFADLIATNNLIFVQGRNSSGAVVIFDPALPPFLNTLTQITPGEGYYVRVQSGATLEICGAPIDPAFKKDLNAGINIVAYVPQASTTPQDYFADLITTSNLVFARGYDLGFEIFDPALPPFLNTLTSIDNSFGYEMRVQFAVPGTNWLSDEDVADRNADADPLAQSINYDVLAAITNLGDDATGEVVYLETETGLLLGTMEVLPGGYLMTTPVYGFDAGLDESIDLHPGDRIVFRYGAQVVDAGVVYQGDKRIRLVEVNFNESPLSTGVIELQPDMFRVFPNPFASSFNLSYRLHSEARVSIRLVSVTGQLVDQLQAEILQPAGPYELRWNNTQYLSAGVYFVQVFVDGQPVANLPVVYQD